MIIPVDRAYNWLAGTTVGVRGGIPSAAYTMFCNIKVSIPGMPGLVAAGDGTTNDDGAFYWAWKLCPPGQYVYVPPGSYVLTGIFTENQDDNRCMRGAGPDLTTILFQPTSGQPSPFKCGNTVYPLPGRPQYSGSPAGVAITSGGNRGSSSVVVTDASRFVVGKMCRFDATTANFWVWAMNQYRLSSGNGPAMSSMAMVTGIAGSTVTFTPPLPIDLMSYSPVLNHYSSNPKFNVGIEDLTIDLIGGDAGSAVEFNSMVDSWLRNVKVTGAHHHQLFWNHCLFCEIRHCTMTNCQGGGPSHEGIDFYGDCCWNLVEDNITFNGGFPAIIFGDGAGGCVGNVVSYNFGKDVNTATELMGADISFSHGCHNMFNLAEGNVGGMFQVDGYFGSASHFTLYRNWFHGKHTGVTQAIKCLHINHFSIKSNIVGNVIGDSTWLLDGIPYKDAPYVNNYDNGNSNGAKAQISVGFPYIGGTSFDATYDKAAATPPTLPDYRDQNESINSFQFGIDYNVAATMIRHGNFHHGYSSGPEWDSGIADHSLPDSLLYSSKPAWFGNLAWPPIDPANPPMTANNATFATTNPAGYRFVNGVDPTGPAPSASRQSLSKRYPRQLKVQH